MKGDIERLPGGSTLRATKSCATKIGGNGQGFANLPKTYKALCGLYLPRPFRDKSTYNKALRMIEAMAGFEEQFNQDHRDYFVLVTELILEFESKIDNVQIEQASFRVRLQHLLESAGWTASDFSAFLGVDAATGNKILGGGRKLTLKHAGRLGRHFSLNAEYFL